MRIKKSEDGIILYLNKNLYDENIIDSLITNFGDLCKIMKGDGKSYLLVNFSGLAPEELEEVALEFSNHALAMTKGR
jgi:hypothetical protein